MKFATRGSRSAGRTLAEVCDVGSRRGFRRNRRSWLDEASQTASGPRA